MTPKDVFELRKQKAFEEAYALARQLYAVDKGSYASLAMFLAATDILKIRLKDGHLEEAKKIYLALERMIGQVPDKEGWIKQSFENSQKLMTQAESRQGQKSEHLQNGIWGEELAVAYLLEEGYVVLERDWHSGHRDIDIIATQDNTLVFIEVKTRRHTDYAAPAEAVNYHKQRNLLLAINHYIKYHRTNMPYRFDVITVIGTPHDNNPQIDHIRDFQLSM